MAVHPITLLAPLSGSLAYQGFNGGGTITGNGAVRYMPASGARVNLINNPSLETNSTGWSGSGVTVASSAEWFYKGSKSLKVTVTAVGAATGAYCQTSGLTMALATPGVGYVGSCYVYNPGTSTRSVRMGMIFRDLNGGSKGSFYTSYYDLAPGETTRLVKTGTAPAGTEGAYLVVYTDNAGTYPFSNGDVLYADAFMLEAAASVSDYFDGSTDDGACWLDPRLGYLGTAHAAPSVSRAALWAWEGTTNTVPDPSFENATITNWWTAANVATISKITTNLYVGSNGGKVSCTASTSDGIVQLTTSGSAAATGQTWTLQARIRAFAAGDVGKTVKLRIVERTSANATVLTNDSTTFTLTDAWQLCTYTVTLSGGGTVAKVTMGVMNGAASAVDFVVDAVQLEQKAYATAYADGSLGTGHSWSGSAHASSSTRTATVLTVNNSSHIRPSSGSVAAYSQFDITSTGSHQFLIGSYDAGPVKRVYMYRNSSGQKLTDGLGDTDSVVQSAGATSLNTWYFGEIDWNGSTTAVNLNGTRSADTAYTGLSAAPAVIAIGQSNSLSQVDGKVGPFVVSWKPLTTIEQAFLLASPNWGWTTLKKKSRGARLT